MFSTSNHLKVRKITRYMRYNLVLISFHHELTNPLFYYFIDTSVGVLVLHTTDCDACLVADFHHHCGGMYWICEKEDQEKGSLQK